MNLNLLTELFYRAIRDEETNITHLKQALKDNDYKLCSDAAMVMLGEMSDLGMDEMQRTYWETLALTHLPQHPWQALKE